ncbi:polysaccharide export protein [Sphingomonas sp. R647]|uniref:polysaccharide biosynthesis/export family protein n=1 Tax=Sphingomonas sp. R647 TaxID=2875233 RepID=UPI001CD1AE97|nr:polysaccharide biosynthesis/export family protein [Sphingomonas sp. R647]MCA1199546.1 polysaccharide export protein [Sphingomonas sp. R647]
MEAVINARFITLITLACAVSACAAKPNFRPELATVAEVADRLPVPSISDTSPRQRAPRIGAFDKLTVTVFGVPELTTSGSVDASGTFNLPLVGAVPAEGLTSGELASELRQRFARYVRDPQVNVVIDQAVSQQVTIDGSVARPGVYQVSGDTTLLRAIAISGGLSEDALKREVLIFRTVEGKRMIARFDMNEIRGARAEDPAVFGNDVIVVGSNSNRSLFKDAIQAAPLLSLFYLIR